MDEILKVLNCFGGECLVFLWFVYDKFSVYVCELFFLGVVFD